MKEKEEKESRAMPGESSDEVVFGGVRASRGAYIDFVAKYRGDREFKARVDRDPTQALREEGFDVPDGVEVKLVEPNRERLDIFIPGAPNG